MFIYLMQSKRYKIILFFVKITYTCICQILKISFFIFIQTNYNFLFLIFDFMHP